MFHDLGCLADPIRYLRTQAFLFLRLGRGSGRFVWNAGGCLLFTAALAEGFKEHHGSGGGDVEGTDAASHGDAQEMIAGAADEFVETVAFAAHDQGAVAGEVELVVVHSAALVETDDPDVLTLELFEGADEVDDAGDAEMLLGSGGGLGGYGAQGRGAALGHDHCVDSGSVGGAKECAEVLGIFNAVEGEDEARGGDGFQNVLDGEELLGANDGDDSLVSRGVGHVGEGFAGLGAEADFEVAAEGDDGFEAVIAAFAGYQHVIEAAFARFERLFDRVQSVENLHIFSVDRVRFLWAGDSG